MFNIEFFVSSTTNEKPAEPKQNKRESCHRIILIFTINIRAVPNFLLILHVHNVFHLLFSIMSETKNINLTIFNLIRENRIVGNLYVLLVFLNRKWQQPKALKTFENKQRPNYRNT